MKEVWRTNHPRTKLVTLLDGEYAGFVWLRMTRLEEVFLLPMSTPPNFRNGGGSLARCASPH
jgi:hypothetical protein